MKFSFTTNQPSRHPRFDLQIFRKRGDRTHPCHRRVAMIDSHLLVTNPPPLLSLSLSLTHTYKHPLSRLSLMYSHAPLQTLACKHSHTHTGTFPPSPFLSFNPNTWSVCKWWIIFHLLAEGDLSLPTKELTQHPSPKKLKALKHLWWVSNVWYIKFNFSKFSTSI